MSEHHAMADPRAHAASRPTPRPVEAVSPGDGQIPADVCRTPGQRIGFDVLDGVSMSLLPGNPDKVAAKSTCQLATAIMAEGARGAAVQRLLAREIASRRVRMRTYQGLADSLARRTTRDSLQLKQMQVFSSIALQEQRALFAALELLDRLTTRGPSVSIAARNAAVWIGGVAGGAP